MVVAPIPRGVYRNGVRYGRVSHLFIKRVKYLISKQVTMPHYLFSQRRSIQVTPISKISRRR